MTLNHVEELEMDTRLRVLLPEIYKLSDDEVKPLSMRSAPLKYGSKGKVLWDEMWRTFCDLAMAGGPPHRGTLLEPFCTSEPDMRTPPYEEVSAEICRGIALVTGLCAEQSLMPGWIQLYCTSAAMAGWLTRAIVMENVSACGKGLALYLPTDPAFRLEKEVKNVITAVAKTCHYWQDHMPGTKHEEIASLLARMERETPLITPALKHDARSDAARELANSMARALHEVTGLERSDHGYPNWLGFDCRNVRAAIWMMRALAVGNLLSRREGSVVFAPVNPASDSTGERSVRAVVQAHRLALARGIIAP